MLRRVFLLAVPLMLVSLGAPAASGNPTSELVPCLTDEADFWMRESSINKFVFFARGTGGFRCPGENMTMIYSGAELNQDWGGDASGASVCSACSGMGSQTEETLAFPWMPAYCAIVQSYGFAAKGTLDTPNYVVVGAGCHPV